VQWDCVPKRLFRKVRWCNYKQFIYQFKQQACILNVGKPEGKRSVEKAMSGWDDNIKVNHTEYTVYIWLRKGASGEIL